MRTFAIGDIHGCLTALNAVLRCAAPTADDTIITLGDYTDRGPDSKGVLDRLCELYDMGQLVPLCGNHDEMMVSARDGNDRRLWLSCGGRETLASYGHGEWEKEYNKVPDRHWRFLEEDCRDYYETDTHIFVHGNVHPELAMTEQDIWAMRWQKLREEVRHCSGKIVVCGHTKQYEGVPAAYEKTLCLDTGAYDSGGWLTCLHIESGRYWQANQRGETREGNLDDLRRRVIW